MSQTQQQLLQLEHQGWQALCDGTGGAFYGELMSDAGVMILAHGYAFDRKAVVESLEHAPTWDSYEITDPVVISLGPDQAILRYTGTGRRHGEPDFVALMASIYIRHDDAWRLVHYQQTPVPISTPSD
ncbi:nuclear transport factor 2 family protein [Enteractinococcus helveticum]|uniref:DUF4440 domain-containing protein n=1 Tax=Enteractinococcus helveticum TaxID=1837282 RepID=A0A1B7M0Z8_9MICC|nr:nuclear transport factor 2 family protein [Enteractinococcus helveticum]OAV61885.1 DUF4440 domain-containing protein [Enteractinococcus helveticum]